MNNIREQKWQKKTKNRLTETECGVHSPLPNPSSLTPLYGCELYLNVGTVQDTLAFRGGYTVHNATSHFNFNFCAAAIHSQGCGPWSGTQLSFGITTPPEWLHYSIIITTNTIKNRASSLEHKQTFGFVWLAEIVIITDAPGRIFLNGKDRKVTSITRNSNTDRWCPYNPRRQWPCIKTLPGQSQKNPYHTSRTASRWTTVYVYDAINPTPVSLLWFTNNFLCILFENVSYKPNPPPNETQRGKSSFAFEW